MSTTSGMAKGGILPWNYGRENFAFYQQLRWERHSVWHKMSIKEAGMFREDVADITAAVMGKLKLQAPLMVLFIWLCLEVFCHGRMGLGQPGPPTFASAMYLQTIGLAMAFLALGLWFLIHAAMKAQLASVHLRTRKVRLPVPSQRQLDCARRLFSSFEEQTEEDIFRLPGLAGASPNWVKQEEIEIPQEPALPKHFEELQELQRSWLALETYSGVCYSYGVMHMVQGTSYWLAAFIITQQGLIWCGILSTAGTMAAMWLMHRMDLLPAFGPEGAGPLVTAIALALAYDNTSTSQVVDLSRACGIIVLLLQLLWTFRLYTMARPSFGNSESHTNRFSLPLLQQSSKWLPETFQNVAYLVATPPPTGQAEDVEDPKEAEDAMDKTPWRYTRTLLLVAAIGWLGLLGGRIVELETGERAILTNPGNSPWSRVWQWGAWEMGPVSSQGFSHVSPQSGHFAWSKGLGPNGRQQKWPTNLFGSHPEADAWWSEDAGPSPQTGAAGMGPNTWAQQRMEAVTEKTTKAPAASHSDHKPSHDDKHAPGSTSKAPGGGGHHRLLAARTPEALAVEWPALLEPELLACGPDGQVLALNSAGFGALVTLPEEGRAAAVLETLTLNGLYQLGGAKAVTWSSTNLLVLTGQGVLASCSAPGFEDELECSPLQVPPLPMGRAAALLEGEPLRAAVARRGSVVLLELSDDVDGEVLWKPIQELPLPANSSFPEVVSLTAREGQLTAMGADGSASQWSWSESDSAFLLSGEDAAAGPALNWQSACQLPESRTLRLASRWRRFEDGVMSYEVQLLL